MAIKEFVNQNNEGFNDLFMVCTWSNLNNGDEGKEIQVVGYADRSIQVDGSFDGGSLEMKGSNDGINYYTLTDPQGNALSFTTAKIEQVSEITRFIKPVATGGASTNIKVSMLLRKGYR